MVTESTIHPLWTDETPLSDVWATLCGRLYEAGRREDFAEVDRLVKLTIAFEAAVNEARKNRGGDA